MASRTSRSRRISVKQSRRALRSRYRPYDETSISGQKQIIVSNIGFREQVEELIHRRDDEAMDETIEMYLQELIMDGRGAERV